MTVPSLALGPDVLAGFFRLWREARERVERDARDLLTWMGDPAYYEARERARACRAKGDRAGDRHWGKVAVEIARRTGHVIGEAAARYVEDAEIAEAEQPVPNRRAIIAELIEIAEAIRDLSHGERGPTSLHNVDAAVYRLVGFAQAPLAEVAGRELRTALADLARARSESVSSLEAGIYPPQAERAGKALQRLREIVLPAR